jgi:hypothetical protein
MKRFFGDEYQDFDLVVSLPNGRPCEDRVILDAFYKLREEAGLPRVVFLYAPKELKKSVLSRDRTDFVIGTADGIRTHDLWLRSKSPALFPCVT